MEFTKTPQGIPQLRTPQSQPLYWEITWPIRWIRKVCRGGYATVCRHSLAAWRKRPSNIPTMR